MNRFSLDDALRSVVLFLIHRRRQAAIDLLLYLKEGGVYTKEPLEYLSEPVDDQAAIARALYFFRAKEYDVQIPLEDNPLSGLDIPAGGSALDLGCGTGQVGAMLKAKGIAILHGVDLSPEMIEICRTKGIYDRLSIATVEAVADMTELADAFDIVIAMGVAPHLVPEQMLGMIRIGLWAAKSSGLLIFNAPTDANGFPLNRLAGSQNHAHAGIVACLEAAGATLGWRDAGEGGDLRRIYWARKP